MSVNTVGTSAKDLKNMNNSNHLNIVSDMDSVSNMNTMSIVSNLKNVKTKGNRIKCYLDSLRRSGLALLLVSAAALASSGCGIQAIPRSKNDVEAAQAEVANQYQRRSDLIPNLVNIVKGAAANEKDILEAVVNARAKATSVQVNIDDPESLKRYQAAQGEVTQALGKLLAISENYPQIKSNESFRDLQVQLEGTENRITIARNRAIAAIKEFNNLVTVFPTSIVNNFLFHYSSLPQYGADKDLKVLEQVPTVDFGK